MTLYFHSPFILSQQLFDPLYRFYGILSVAEGRQTEIPLALTAEALAGCSDHLSVLEKIIKELPAPHALRTFEPDIRRVFAARIEYPQLVERLGDDPGVLFIVGNIGFEFFLPFLGEYRSRGTLHGIGYAVEFGRLSAVPKGMDIVTVAGKLLRDHRIAAAHAGKARSL